MIRITWYLYIIIFWNLTVVQLSILLSFSFATTFLVCDLSENYYVEISSNSHLSHIFETWGCASVNSFKFQLCNHLFNLRSFYQLIYRNIKQFWSFFKSHLSHIFETWGWCNCQLFKISALQPPFCSAIFLKIIM